MIGASVNCEKVTSTAINMISPFSDQIFYTYSPSVVCRENHGTARLTPGRVARMVLGMNY